MLVWISYKAAGLLLNAGGETTLLAMPVVCVGLAWFYRRIRPDVRIAFGSETTAQIIVILLLATLLSFAAATADFPYRDAELNALDRAMGFDWRAYLHFVNAHPWLGHIGTIAYASMKPQTPFVILMLVIGARFVRLQQFVLATHFSLLICIAISVFVPAVAYYAHLGVAPAEFANLTPTVPYAHIPHLAGLRSGATRIVRLDDLERLITFPSFHAAPALLFTWALWPFRRLRWAIAALNVALLAWAPIDGAHYAIDIVGGLAITALVLVGVRRMFTTLARRSASAVAARPLAEPAPGSIEAPAA